jgi:lipopolysaccharide export system protein LptC
VIGRDTTPALGPASRVPRSGRLTSLLTDWLARLPGNSYSRRVALLKLALPAIGGTLLLMVAAWPRLAPLFDRFRWAAIDLREARELRMINPRYAGTDKDGHPFVVTAAVGRQVPERDDVMSLDQPVANGVSHSGAKIVVTADSGVYQTQTQFLDMFGNVTVTHENGSVFTTTAARLDVANNAAEGSAPVAGHGPQGSVSGQGFHILDKGDIVIFTGQSSLMLNGTKQQAPATAPDAVPVPVAQAAVQLEAKAELEAKPGATATAPAHPAAASKGKPAAKQAAKAPAHPVAHATPPAKKPG